MSNNECFKNSSSYDVMNHTRNESMVITLICSLTILCIWLQVKRTCQKTSSKLLTFFVLSRYLSYTYQVHVFYLRPVHYVSVSNWIDNDVTYDIKNNLDMKRNHMSE